jgi:uncharacterized membrane protein YccC
MSTIATTGRSFRDWLTRRRVELRLTFRVTTSAVLALAASHLLNLPVALWTVLTAVILTQLSVGRSLKATTDYLTGTLGGAIYAGAVGALIPQTGEISLLVGLAIAVAPAVLLAAIKPRFSAAPFTAVMVFLAPTLLHTGPVVSAFERVVEVAVGGIVGLVVSVVVLPARAHDLAMAAAAQMLDLMATFVPELFAKFTEHRNEAPLQHVQSSIGEAFSRLDTVALEARHERMTRLAAEPDQAPLLRTLLRLRHDLVMIGRAAVTPLPVPVQARLEPWLARIGTTAAAFLRACAAALLARAHPPSIDEVTTALDGYAGAINALRREGLTRGLPDDAVEQVFALGFALDQMHMNLKDLSRCVVELTSSGDAAIAGVSANSSCSRR